MNSQRTIVNDRVKKERAKKAVAFAMQGHWEEAVELNRLILKDFPGDLETYNRLGKALSELGHNRQAREAFQQALEISPHNSIAKKNLDRLMRLGEDESPRPISSSVIAAPKVFIEESGKSGLTSLLNLASPQVLLKLTPGEVLELIIEGNKMKVKDSSGEYAGQVEPKIASRLIRLIGGGNTYQATVTSSNERELILIIREIYKHPSQVSIVSFPTKGGSSLRVVVPAPALDYEDSEGEPAELGSAMLKDWSDDDTEPGDDEAFAPSFQRIVNSPDDDVDGDSNDDY